MRFAFALGIGVMFLSLAAVAQPPKSGRPKRNQVELKVGAAAPNFVLTDVDGKNPVRLSDLKGKPVVLVFGSCT